MIEIKELCTGYGKKQILNHLSLTVEQGRLTSLIGPNGCGKSTLLKAITGIVPVMSGEISLDGALVGTLGRKDLAKRISYLAQGKSAPDMTVAQMVLHGRFPHLSYPRRYTEDDKRIAAQAMERSGVLEYAERPMSSLSGGMRQNAYIAMALAQDTDHILLDEPTTYLDISNQAELVKGLRALAVSGKAVLTVLHDIPMALAFSDTVAVMDGGIIVALGTPDEIYASGVIDTVFGVSVRRTDDESGYYYLMK